MNTLGSHLPLVVRLALRSLKRSPSYTITVALILGVVFGPLVLILSAAANIYVEPHRMMARHELFTVSSSQRGLVSYPNYASLAPDASASQIRLAAYRLQNNELKIGETGFRAQTALVTDRFFATVGAKLARGRDIDATVLGPYSCIISARLWSKAFASSPAIIGQPVQIAEKRYTVAGVASDGFHGIHLGESVDVWLPLVTDEANADAKLLSFRDAPILNVVARSQYEAQVGVFSSRLNETAKRLASEYPETNTGVAFAVRPVDASSSDAQLSRLFILAALATALLIGAVSVNLASLGVARASTRIKELATMRLLGADNNQLLAPLAVESVLLATLGIVISGLLTRALIVALNNGSATPIEVVHPKWYASLTALLFAVLIGAASAAFAMRKVVGKHADYSARSFARPMNNGLIAAAVVCQIGVGTAALGIAGAIIEGARKAEHADPGFRVQGVVTAEFSTGTLPRSDVRVQAATLRRLIDELRRSPDVIAVALGNSPLLNGWQPLRFPIARADANGGHPLSAEFDQVGPNFFSTLGLPVLMGREFSEDDFTGSKPRVVIVSQSLAKLFWPGESPLGKAVRVRSNIPATVIGEVADAPLTDIKSEPGPRFYIPILNFPTSTLHAFVRLRPTATRIPAELSTALSVLPIKTPSRVEYQSLDDIRRLALLPFFTVGDLVIAIATTTLLIGAIGLYGTLTTVARSHHRDFAIRIALGATIWRALSAVGLRLGIALSLGVVSGLGIAVAVLSRVPVLTFHGSWGSVPSVLFEIAAVALVAVVAALGPIRAVMRMRIPDLLANDA